MSSWLGRWLMSPCYMRLLIYVAPTRIRWWPSRDFSVAPQEIELPLATGSEARPAAGGSPVSPGSSATGPDRPAAGGSPASPGAWTEAAKWIAKFSEGVLNAVDGGGYPVSVRQTSLPFDAASGAMAVTLPESLGAVAGPASLLCHFHDENLWKLRAILVRGRIERRGGGWVFVTTAFAPPSMWQMMKNVKKSTRTYLETRGLPMPKVDYVAIAELWRRAREVPKE
ncbi:MAG: hypothetical protein EXR72_05280 [Myxococcales bacterium]|nr:hypothetical protein [Myxococcales bacterium]